MSYLTELVRTESAVELGPNCHNLVESRLAGILHQEGVSTLTQLVNLLRQRPGSRVVDQVVDALMTHETSFFRDRPLFELFSQKVVPEAVKNRGDDHSLVIWSAACSTGQEPYSIAMSLLEEHPQLRSWQITIVGSDVSALAVEKAKAGRYNDIEANRGIPPQLLDRYFRREGRAFVINPNVSQMVRFMRINLAGRWPAIPRPDVIFLRNVMIYFGHDTRMSIVDQIKKNLRPGGMLLADASDVVLASDGAFDRLKYGRTVYYQRK